MFWSKTPHRHEDELVARTGTGGEAMTETKRSALHATLALAVCALVGLPQGAEAQDKPSRSVELPDEMGRNEYMVTVRARAIAIPSVALDPIFDQHPTHWSEGQRNAAFGGQFTWRAHGDYELGVAIDWADLTMPSAFWLQANEEPDQADYVDLDLRMLSVVFTSHWFWDPVDWLSPYVGVGLGIGVLRGQIMQYDPSARSDCQADLGKDDNWAPESCFGDNGEPDPSQFTSDSPRPAERQPPVIPVLNVSGGLRFNIHKYNVIRLEVGFQNHLYAGLGVGVQWW